MQKGKVGVLELIASTVAPHSRFRPRFWTELAIRQQFYSVMPQAVAVWSRMRRFHEGRSRTLPTFPASRMRGRLGHHADAPPREAQRQWAPTEARPVEAAAA